jgi:hypothetical protein
MKLNRRSVLGAIGTIGIGTGAAFGSGAFSQVTAERAVQVNVLGGEDGLEKPGEGVGDGQEQSNNNDIAENILADFADVLVDASSDSVSILNRDDNAEDEADLYPTVNPADYNTAIGGEYVSLVANDVTVLFGPDGNELPAESTITHDDFFAIQTDNNKSFDVTFTSDDDPNNILTGIGDGEGNTNDPNGGVTVSGASGFEQVPAEIQTGTSSGSREGLTIDIVEN